MKKRLRRLLVLALRFSGINVLFRRANQNRAAIIWYHGIAGDRPEEMSQFDPDDHRHLPVALFERHLVWLLRHGYELVSLSALVSRIRNNQCIAKHVALTFDDGFESVLDNAYPMMLKHGASGCVYVATAVAETGGMIWTDQVEEILKTMPEGPLALTVGDHELTYLLGDSRSRFSAARDVKRRIRELPHVRQQEALKQLPEVQAAGTAFRIARWSRFRAVDKSVLEIGSHTRTHPNLTTIEQAELLEGEVCGSYDDVRRNIACDAVHFCYPAGDLNDRVAKLVRERGYASATTTEQGLIDTGVDIFRLPRVSTDDDIDLFAACVSGSYYQIVGPVTHFVRKAFGLLLGT